MLKPMLNKRLGSQRIIILKPLEPIARGGLIAIAGNLDYKLKDRNRGV
jgi:hypothetical protein